MNDTVQIYIRDSYAITHLQSMVVLARHAQLAENLGMPQAHMLTKGYAMCAIIESVCFLEALINEYYLDAVEDVEGPNKLNPAPAALALHNAWVIGNVDRLPILDKFQYALSICGFQPLDSGHQPFQDAADVIAVRNLLVHYKPETLLRYCSETEIAQEKLEKRLQRKFALSPFTYASDPFLARILGSGGAEWAVRSALAFADAYFARLGIGLPHAHVLKDLAV